MSSHVEFFDGKMENRVALLVTTSTSRLEPTSETRPGRSTHPRHPPHALKVQVFCYGSPVVKLRGRSAGKS